MRVLAVAFSLIGLLLAGTAAQAEWRGFATTDVNMRSGPGTGYAVIDLVPEGARVFVDSCGGNWCDVTYRGEEGFVSRRYLEQTRVRDYAPQVEIYPPVYIEPDYAEERRARRYRRQLQRERRARPNSEHRVRRNRRARGNAEHRARQEQRARERRRERQIREERRERQANRVRRRANPDRNRNRRQDPTVVRRNNPDRSASNDRKRIRPRNRVVEQPVCPTSRWCGGGIGPDPSNRK